MRANIIGFALGVALLQQQPQLPPLYWSLSLLPAFGLWWWLGRFRSQNSGLATILSASGGDRGPSRARWMRLLLSAHTVVAQLLAFVVCIGAGFFYAAAWADWRLADRLPSQWEGVDVSVVG